MQTKPDVMNIRTIKSEDIPDIQLYMDQVLEFFESQIGANKRTAKEPIFTKTMINNYVKADVISPPIKKKYSKEALMDLAMVYAFKQVLSIQDTQALIKALHTLEASPYGRFKAIEDTILKNIKDTYPDPNHESAEDKDSLEPLVSQIVALTLEASIKKGIAEKLLDQLSNSISDSASK